MLTTGPGAYVVTLPLVTAGDTAEAESAFRTWLWYAARRDELALGGAAGPVVAPADVATALRSVATTLDLTDESVEALAARCETEVFAAGEKLLREGRVPSRYMFVLDGVVGLSVSTVDGAWVDVTRLDRGEIVGSSGLLREPTSMTATALTLVEVLQVPLDVVDEIVASNPAVARRLNALVDARREQRRTALAAV